MSTLRSQATAGSKRGLFARLFTPSNSRAVRKAVSRARKGQPDPFGHLAVLAADKRALAFLATGEALRDTHPDAAFGALQQALALDFTSITACVQFAQLAFERGALEPGISQCRRLLAQTPAQVPVVAELARLLVADDQPRAALGAIAETGHEDLPILSLRQGQALIAIDEREAALASLDHAIHRFATELDRASERELPILTALLAEAQAARDAA